MMYADENMIVKTVTSWYALSARRSKEKILYPDLSAFIGSYPVKKLFITMMHAELRILNVSQFLFAEP